MDFAIELSWMCREMRREVVLSPQALLMISKSSHVDMHVGVAMASAHGNAGGAKCGVCYRLTGAPNQWGDNAAPGEACASGSKCETETTCQGPLPASVPGVCQNMSRGLVTSSQKWVCS